MRYCKLILKDNHYFIRVNKEDVPINNYDRYKYDYEMEKWKSSTNIYPIKDENNFNFCLVAIHHNPKYNKSLPNEIEKALEKGVDFPFERVKITTHRLSPCKDCPYPLEQEEACAEGCGDIVQYATLKPLKTVMELPTDEEIKKIFDEFSISGDAPMIKVEGAIWMRDYIKSNFKLVRK